MSGGRLKILIVEDNPGDARLIREALADAARFRLAHVERLGDALKRLGGEEFDVVLLDLGLPDSQGLDTLVRLRTQAPHVPITVLTGLEDEELGLKLVQAGAQDYLVKGQVSGQLLTRGLRHAIERKRVEEQLRRSEERFRSLAEAAPDGIIAMGADGHIHLFNKAAERVFGYSAEEMLGRSVDVLVPPEYGDRHVAAIRRYLESGEPTIIGKTVERTALRKGGEAIPVGLSVSAFRFGTDVTFIGIVRDLTERKRTEETLRQREKLAAMGELLAGVAHELNNPLSVVLGQAALLGRSAAGGPLGARAEKISQAAERCARIVKNFLALARQYPPERQEVQLNQTVREAVEMLAYPLRVDNVEVRLDLAQDLPILWADPHQLHQVLVNLVTNAHHAMREAPAPRRLTLTTRCEPGGSRVSLVVADTGPGIPPEIQTRIFEPFFTTKPPGQGTGLGLSLCHGMVQGHGGTIGVESQPGRGATFLVELPVIAPPAAEAEAQAGEAAPPIRGKAILVVDDEPEIAVVLAEMLAVQGQQVETAANGALALDKLRQKTYDVVLTDIKMPEIDGPGLYRELERRHPDLVRRVIFLTGDTLSPETTRFLEQTRAPSLRKPFTAEGMRRAVQQVLRSNMR